MAARALALVGALLLTGVVSVQVQWPGWDELKHALRDEPSAKARSVVGELHTTNKTEIEMLKDYSVATLERVETKCAHTLSPEYVLKNVPNTYARISKREYFRFKCAALVMDDFNKLAAARVANQTAENSTMKQSVPQLDQNIFQDVGQGIGRRRKKEGRRRREGEGSRRRKGKEKEESQNQPSEAEKMKQKKRAAQLDWKSSDVGREALLGLMQKCEKKQTLESPDLPGVVHFDERSLSVLEELPKSEKDDALVGLCDRLTQSPSMLLMEGAEQSENSHHSASRRRKKEGRRRKKEGRRRKKEGRRRENGRRTHSQSTQSKGMKACRDLRNCHASVKFWSNVMEGCAQFKPPHQKASTRRKQLMEGAEQSENTGRRRKKEERRRRRKNEKGVAGEKNGGLNQHREDEKRLAECIKQGPQEPGNMGSLMNTKWKPGDFWKRESFPCSLMKLGMFKQAFQEWNISNDGSPQRDPPAGTIPKQFPSILYGEGVALGGVNVSLSKKLQNIANGTTLTKTSMCFSWYQIRREFEHTDLMIPLSPASCKVLFEQDAVRLEIRDMCKTAYGDDLKKRSGCERSEQGGNFTHGSQYGIWNNNAKRFDIPGPQNCTKFKCPFSAKFECKISDETRRRTTRRRTERADTYSDTRRRRYSDTRRRRYKIEENECKSSLPTERLNKRIMDLCETAFAVETSCCVAKYADMGAGLTPKEERFVSDVLKDF